MLLDNELADTDEKVRKLYVGMTRAKKNLYIHCNTGVFASIVTGGVQYQHDANHYPIPGEITMQLSFHDVYLDYFKDKKKLILQLRSGMPLYFDNGFFRIESGERVACASKQIRKELQEWSEKGYQAESAKVSFVVAWKGKEAAEESAVLLPELTLKNRDAKS